MDKLKRVSADQQLTEKVDRPGVGACTGGPYDAPEPRVFVRASVTSALLPWRRNSNHCTNQSNACSLSFMRYKYLVYSPYLCSEDVSGSFSVGCNCEQRCGYNSWLYILCPFV